MTKLRLHQGDAKSERIAHTAAATVCVGRIFHAEAIRRTTLEFVYSSAVRTLAAAGANDLV